MNRQTFAPLMFAMLAMGLAVIACVSGGSAPPDALPVPTESSAAVSTIVPELTAQPAVPERRRLTLDYPPRIRAGDSDVVRLTLEMDSAGNLTPTAIVEGNVVTGEVIEIPNLYETHHVIVEARFDVAGIQVSPPGLSSQTLEPGQKVQFFWSVKPEEVGVYRGTIWVNLRFVDKVSGEESQRAVSAQLVEIEAASLFGIPANVARIAGGVGSVVGAVVGLPFFEDIVKYLFQRRRKKAA